MSARLVGCTHSCTTGSASGVLSITTVQPLSPGGTLPCPAVYHVNMKQAQLDAVVIGLRRIAEELGGTSNGDGAES